eukprot:g5676.t1
MRRRFVRCERCHRTVAIPPLAPNQRPVCPCGALLQPPTPNMPSVEQLVQMLLQAHGGSGGASLRTAGASDALIRSLPTHAWKAPTSARASKRRDAEEAGTDADAASEAASAAGAALSKQAAGGSDAHADVGGVEEEGPSCTICLCEFEDGDVVTSLPCLHTFHKTCCVQWLKEKSTCPMCNVSLSELFKRQREAERTLLSGAGPD